MRGALRFPSQVLGLLLLLLLLHQQQQKKKKEGEWRTSQRARLQLRMGSHRPPPGRGNSCLPTAPQQRGREKDQTVEEKVEEEEGARRMDGQMTTLASAVRQVFSQPTTCRPTGPPAVDLPCLFTD